MLVSVSRHMRELVDGIVVVESAVIDQVPGSVANTPGADATTIDLRAVASLEWIGGPLCSVRQRRLWPLRAPRVAQRKQ